MSINQDDINSLSKVTQGEFNIEAIRDDGDSNPPTLKELNNSGSQNPAINYQVALSGFWKFLDMMLGIAAKQTKGRIEYTNLTDTEIQAISAQSAQSPHFRSLASMENAPTWLVCVSAVGTFGSHVKVNPSKDKIEEKQKGKLSLTPEELEILSKVSKSNDGKKLAEQIKNIPSSELEKNLVLEPFSPITIDDMLSEDEQKIKQQLFGNGDLTPEMLEKVKLHKASESRRIQKELDEARNRNTGGVGYAS